MVMVLVMMDLMSVIMIDMVMMILIMVMIIVMVMFIVVMVMVVMLMVIVIMMMVVVTVILVVMIMPFFMPVYQYIQMKTRNSAFLIAPQSVDHLRDAGIIQRVQHALPLLILQKIQQCCAEHITSCTHPQIQIQNLHALSPLTPAISNSMLSVTCIFYQFQYIPGF